MSLIIVITFGTSDVQFERTSIISSGFSLETKKEERFDSNFLKPAPDSLVSISLKRNRDLDSYLLVSPRKEGKTLLDNFDAFASIISLPLTLPVIKKLLEEGKSIGKFVLVYTDQHDASEKYISLDTLYYAKIFQKFIMHTYPDFTEDQFLLVPIQQKVTDIDFQYVEIAKTCKSFFQTPVEEISQLILLAQGGIDQINQALTLQLIQAFGAKLIIYQQAEDQKPKQLNFTNLFLQDLIKQQALALVKATDYHGAKMLLDMIENDDVVKVKTLIAFAGFRKVFLFKEADKVANALGRKKPEFIENYVNRINSFQNLENEIDNKEFLFLIAERFYLSDFYFTRQNYTDFVLAFQIFFETICNRYLSHVYGVDLRRKYHDTLSQLFETISCNEPELYKAALDKLNVNNGSLRVSFPAIAALTIIISEKRLHHTVYQITEPLLHINSQLNGYAGSNGLDVLRNSIAHEGKGVLPEDLYLASNQRNKKDKMEY